MCPLVLDEKFPWFTAKRMYADFRKAVAENKDGQSKPDAETSWGPTGGDSFKKALGEPKAVDGMEWLNRRRLLQHGEASLPLL